MDDVELKIVDAFEYLGSTLPGGGVQKSVWFHAWEVMVREKYLEESK